MKPGEPQPVSSVPKVKPGLQPKPGVSRNKLYSAPRRFDMLTILVISAIYACIFAIFSAFNANPWAIFGFVGFISLVGFCQAWLFGGNMPRLASVLVGGGIVCVTALVGLAMSGPPAVDAGFLVACPTLMGCLIGYCTGAMVGASFWLVEIIRENFLSQISEDEPKVKGADPFGEDLS